MNQHFTEAEFDICISTDVSQLDPTRQLHLKSCTACQETLSRQKDVDRVLSELKPQRMSQDITDKIISIIKQPAIKKIRLNGLITISLILSVILISIQMFQPRTAGQGPLINTERLVERFANIKQPNLELPGFGQISDTIPGLEQIMNFFRSPITMLIIFICFVLGLYMLIDQYFRKMVYKNT